MKKTILAIMLILLLQSVFAYTISADQRTYDKGETITITGDCEQDIELIAKMGEKEIFKEKATCSNDSYNLEYEITNIDPSGQWVISLKQDENTKTLVDVKLTKQSQYLLIDILSPSKTEHFRTQEINIGVKITDTGKPVSNADVYFWDITGKRISLEESKKGTYEKEIEIPIDSQIGDWLLIVTAEKEDEMLLGGEKSLIIPISKAPINIEIVRPTARNFDVESKIPIEVKLTYFDNKNVKDARVSANLNNQVYTLEKQGDSYYFEYQPTKEEIGSLDVIINAKDSGGNEGKLTLDLVVTGDTILIFLKENWITLIIALILAIIIIVLAGKKAKNIIDTNQLKAEKKRLNIELNRLQEDYFTKVKISKETYRKRVREIEEKLSEIEKKLRLK